MALDVDHGRLGRPVDLRGIQHGHLADQVDGRAVFLDVDVVVLEVVLEPECVPKGRDGRTGDFADDLRSGVEDLRDLGDALGLDLFVDPHHQQQRLDPVHELVHELVEERIDRRSRRHCVYPFVCPRVGLDAVKIPEIRRFVKVYGRIVLLCLELLSTGLGALDARPCVLVGRAKV